jgi:hypothetical protein
MDLLILPVLNHSSCCYITYCDVLAVSNRATVECDVNNMADAPRGKHDVLRG